MIWLTLAIFAYLFFALNVIGDKFLLSGSSLKHPSTYAFFVGFLGLGLLVLIPFWGFPIPISFISFSLAFSSGAIFIAALLPFYTGLKKFQASSMIPATGALQPIFILLLSLVLFSLARAISPGEFLAFTLLLLGSVLITMGKKGKISKESLILAALAAFLFALSFVLLKQAYLIESFWAGLLWSRIGAGFTGIIIFLCLPGVRRELYFFSGLGSKTGRTSVKKTAALFVLAQVLGVTAGFLQHASIYEAPTYAIPIISALQGVQYVFLFLLAVFASRKFPDVFEEFYTRDGAIRKILATGMIIAGVTMLVYFR